MQEPSAREGNANSAASGPALSSDSLRLGARMGLLSAASFLLNYGLFAGFAYRLNWRAEAAALLAMVLVMVLNFIACRHYVFAAQQGRWWPQALRFASGTAVFRAAELTVFSLVLRLTHWDDLVVYPSILLVFFLIKMLVYRRFVFNGPQRRV